LKSEPAAPAGPAAPVAINRPVNTANSGPAISRRMRLLSTGRGGDTNRSWPRSRLQIVATLLVQHQIQALLLFLRADAQPNQAVHQLEYHERGHRTPYDRRHHPY